MSGTQRECNYGVLPVKVYPVSDSELHGLRLSAWMALTIIYIPFFIVHVLTFVHRVKRETEFSPNPESTPVGKKDGPER